jgi:hypothetical protein
MNELLRQRAVACVRTIPSDARSFTDDRASFASTLDALIEAVRSSDERFAFDVEGRPGAIAAVREALPASEAELLGAILEDVAAELAAYQEALYQMVVAARQR